VPDDVGYLTPIHLPTTLFRPILGLVKLVGVSAVAVVLLACACSPVEVDVPKSPVASIRPTQFTPPPPPITDDLPTAAQLTALFAASVDYSIREEDRARLFDGPAANNVRLARAWGAQPDPQHIEFTTVASTGPDSVEAMGVGTFGSMEGYRVLRAIRQSVESSA
jgi:hypothetical protein